MKTSIKPPFLSRWIPLMGLLLLGFVLFFYRLGGYPLFDVDEPRYAEAAREMIERGNWITPYFNYELRFDKPVFFYWLVALAYQWFGISEFAARFFSAVSALLMVLMVFAFGRFWVSTRFGLIAAAILATSLQVIGLARMSVTDMTLSTLMTATTLALFMVAHHSRKWWVVAGLLAGLGMLTKGPVALVVPGAVLLIHTLFKRDLTWTFVNRWFPLGLILSLVVALPWYVLCYLENGQIFLDALFLHNVNRFEGVVSGHQQPIYFYFLVLAGGFLPWSLYLPVAFAHWWQKRDLLFQKSTRRSDWVSAIGLFSLIWLLFVFVFFTVAQTKLLTYILPLFPAAALLMAATWHQAAKEPERWLAKVLTISGWVLFAVLLGLGSVFIFNPAALMPKIAQGVSGNLYYTAAVAVLAGGTGVMAALLTLKRFEQAIAAQAVTMALLVVVAMQGVVPSINQATQGAMLSYLKKAGPNALVTYEITRPSLTYYARKKIDHVAHDEYDKLYSILRSPRSRGRLYVITKNRFLDKLRMIREKDVAVTLLDKGPVYCLVTLEKEPRQP